MEASLKLGRIWGIPIGLHISWFLIFGLVTWSLAAGYFPEEYPTLTTAEHWLLGAVTSLLFFGSVLVHELGHAYLALRNDVPVRGITLFVFGGVAQIARDPRTPGAEFRIAIAGPLASLGLALLFGLAWLLSQSIPHLAAPSLWLARINMILAVFNLIPGFPLDGGRVLRSIVWKLTGNYLRATQIAAFMGQLVAFGFIGLGLLTLLGGNLFNGLWLAFIGWFLQNAAAASYSQANLQHSLRGVTVGQVMSQDCPQAPAHLPLARLVEEQVLAGGHRCFLITDDGQLRGMLSLRDVAAVPRAQWGEVTTGQAMIPFERLARVRPDTELLAALQTMDDANVAQVPVVEGSRVAGLLSREHVLHYVRARAELGL
jgi:Zn-dependent protease/CBS domain-containing protein